MKYIRIDFALDSAREIGNFFNDVIGFCEDNDCSVTIESGQFETVLTFAFKDEFSQDDIFSEDSEIGQFFSNWYGDGWEEFAEIW